MIAKLIGRLTFSSGIILSIVASHTCSRPNSLVCSVLAAGFLVSGAIIYTGK